MHIYPHLTRQFSNLDVIFVGARTLSDCKYEIAEDCSSFDHFPVVMDVALRALPSESSTHRLNNKEVDWLKFGVEMDRTLENKELIEPQIALVREDNVLSSIG